MDKLILTEGQIELLQLIYDSEDYGMKEADLPKSKLDITSLYNDLELLLEHDLVEHDEQENKFYLAHEGFERLDTVVRNARPKTDKEQYHEIINSTGGLKKFQRITLLNIFVVAFFITGLMYLNPEIANFKNRNELKIDQSTRDQIQTLVQKKLDSIENLNNLDKLDTLEH